MSSLPLTQILSHIDGIRRAQSRGEFTPHKPLMLLTALAHLQRGAPRLEPFTSYDGELKTLLTRFGRSSAPSSRHYPYWHLRTDDAGKLWDMSGPASILSRSPAATPNLGELKTEAVKAGFAPAIYQALHEQPALIGAVARHVLQASFPESLHADIAQAIGLDLGVSLIAAEMDAPSYEALVQRRRRDANFRNEVLLAYEYKCCVCGHDLRLCHQPVGLEAAHIQWHTADGPDVVNNGLSLCATHHKLFDLGAFTIEPTERRVLFSQHAIGTGQLHLHGQPVSLPESQDVWPGPEFLAWNRRHVFKQPARS